MANFQLTYDGIPFCLDTPEAQDWIDTHIPLSELRINTDVPAWPGVDLQGCAYPRRYPARPDLKLGTFFYPTGFTRWGEFNGLMTQDQVTPLIADYFGATIMPKAFVMQQNGVGPSTPMYLMPPRPLAYLGQSFKNLYLITLVDERWYAQYADSDDVPNDGSESWTQFLTNMAAEFPFNGISLSIDTIADAYAATKPDPNTDLMAQYANTAIMLDAACWNVGLTGVRLFNGNYSAMNINTSNLTLTSNIANQGQMVLAGANNIDITMNAILPNNCTTVFPIWNSKQSDYQNPRNRHVRSPLTWGDGHNRLIPITDIIPAYNGFIGEKVFRDSYLAYTPNGASPFTNNTDLQVLATQIAADYYANQLQAVDITFPSIVNWNPEGVTDLTFHWCKDNCYTRAQKKPHNFNYDQLAHAASSPSSSSSSLTCYTFVTNVQCCDGTLHVSTQSIMIPNSVTCSTNNADCSSSSAAS